VPITIYVVLSKNWWHDETEFEEDPDLYVLPPLNYFGIELWQVCNVFLWVQLCSFSKARYIAMSSETCWICSGVGLTLEVCSPGQGRISFWQHSSNRWSWICQAICREDLGGNQGSKPSISVIAFMVVFAFMVTKLFTKHLNLAFFWPITVLKHG